jgi:hypothetical protein
MNCRIKIILLLLAFAFASARSDVRQISSIEQRSIGRSLEAVPTASPITPPKEHHDKPKPAPKPAKKKPVSKPAPPTPQPASKPATSGSSSGGKHSDLSTHKNDKSNASTTHGGANKPLLLLIGAAASTLIIAGYTKVKRRVPEVKEHPLKGSLGRRMKLFGGLASNKTRGSLDSALEEDMSYKSADEFGITIV